MKHVKSQSEWEAEMSAKVLGFVKDSVVIPCRLSYNIRKSMSALFTIWST